VAHDETIRRVPVLVLGKSITALGALRVMAGHGLKTYGVEATSDIITASRWYTPTPRRLPETADGAELGAFLESLAMPEAVLIACSDKWTSAVAGLPPEVRARFHASVPPPEAVDQFVDKDRFGLLVKRLGIPAPRTFTIRTPADLDRVDAADLRGGFLKPTDSQRHNKLFGTKGAFIESPQAARTLVEQASERGVTFMLQEWIPGGMTATILLDGFVDRTGTMRALMARRRLRMNPPRLGNTTTALTIPIAEARDAPDSLRTLLADVGYRGAFNVEFKLDDRDGRYKIIEVNPRPAWFVATLARAGMDLPWMIYRDALELAVPTSPPYRVGRYAVYETPDATSIVRAWTSRERPDGPVIRPWLRGDHALFWLRDPWPAVVDISRAVRGRLTKTLGRVRRRRLLDGERVHG
jgi:predicted ATP-grasp superfamily ATP-dependent carboligase